MEGNMTTEGRENERNKKGVAAAAVIIGTIITALAAFFTVTIVSNVKRITPVSAPEIDVTSERFEQFTDIQDYLTGFESYDLSFTGLIEEELTASLPAIIEKHRDAVQTVQVQGTRTDGENITSTITGIPLAVLLPEMKLKERVQNVIIYAADLYASVLPLHEVKNGSVFLAWKDNFGFIYPRIFSDRGQTHKWVKRPVLIDFVAEFDDTVPVKDRAAREAVDFVSSRRLFTLSITRVPQINLDGWQLEMSGLVVDARTYSYEEITEMQGKTVYVVLETISNPPGGSSIGNVVMTGTPLRNILSRAGLGRNAREVVFYCEDGYSTSISVREATDENTLIAYEMNGKPLEPEHGFTKSKWSITITKDTGRIEAGRITRVETLLMNVSAPTDHFCPLEPHELFPDVTVSANNPFVRS